MNRPPVVDYQRIQRLSMDEPNGTMNFVCYIITGAFVFYMFKRFKDTQMRKRRQRSGILDIDGHQDTHLSSLGNPFSFAGY